MQPWRDSRLSQTKGKRIRALDSARARKAVAAKKGVGCLFLKTQWKKAPDPFLPLPDSFFRWVQAPLREKAHRR